MSQDTISAAPANGGGSAAARAYRAELGLGTALQDLPEATTTKPLAEARAAVRRKFSGRVRLTFDVGNPTDAKMIDMSVSGACLLVEQMVHAKTPCTLACNIFHEGKAYVFRVRAVAVYSVLASGKGFKVGFQFGPHDEATASQIAALMQ
jgi:hypothetical protein